jgi:hypothetical protein
MPNNKKSAKKRSNKFTKTKADVANAIKASKKLELQLEKVKKDLEAYPYRYRP